MKNKAIDFAKWKDDNYTKRRKGFVLKNADLRTAIYYSYEQLYREYLKQSKK